MLKERDGTGGDRKGEISHNANRSSTLRIFFSRASEREKDTCISVGISTSW